MTSREPDLDDPDYAKLAWGRFKRLFGWMAAFAVVCGFGAIAILWRSTGPLPIHMAIATFLGVTLSILLAAALMGLMFLSSGSGHDARVEDWSRPDDIAE
jgi:hypothetical protein